MSGDHADNVLDGFLATFGMLAVVFPLIGGKRFEEREICFAHDALQFDGFARVAFVVMSGGDPGVLIIGLDGGSRGSEDRAHAPSDYDFDVGAGRVRRLAVGTPLIRRSSFFVVADWSLIGSCPWVLPRMRCVYC